MTKPNLVRDAQIVASDGEAADALGEQDEVLRIPEVEELLHVETRRIALGFIEIRKTVVTEQVMVPVELRREVVEIRQVDDPGGEATVSEAHILQDDTIRIPVFREKAAVQKQIVVTSEVVIDRQLVTERQTLDETLRRSTVTVDEHLDHSGRSAPGSSARLHPETTRPPASDRGDLVHPVRSEESTRGGRYSARTQE